MDQNQVYLLRLNCRDQVGIVSKISTLLAKLFEDTLLKNKHRVFK